MENNINKEILDNGEKSTVIISSGDDKKVNLNGNYTLANNPNKKTNKLIEKYRGSILGRDIGMKSSGFASTTIFAGIISVAVLLVLYFLWRF